MVYTSCTYTIGDADKDVMRMIMSLSFKKKEEDFPFIHRQYRVDSSLSHFWIWE